MSTNRSAARDHLLRRALQLSAISVGFSGVVGIVAVVVGLALGRLSLLGFGFDSAVDSVASVVLIWRFRIESAEPHRAARAEHVAERVVGIVLLVLAAYLAISSIQALLAGAHPEASGLGIGISVVSVLALPPLALAKRRVATALESGALRGDSSLTGLAAILAAVSLLGFGLTELAGIAGADAVGGLIVAAVMAREGFVTVRG
ncbi:MAG TPA: cation transporter [Candidatus Limnocylindrales bacterium]|nr:cation transporter [Candidatus Limnocylindrales bacterium]